ncbi:hypothetical protein KSF_101440 [Reticulibacter mediterranei]|uniref:Uncharacterized protein n=1 Tax=Reticulibacter mediterranei TaxID=2778369 RepID=A0A8J3J1X3_9CHLR|nr:hypothetical protein KSF_101440 [Reticulibacter mediterranei]
MSKRCYNVWQGKVNTPSETNLENMRAIYDTNVFGVMSVTKAMLPLLRHGALSPIFARISVLGLFRQPSVSGTNNRLRSSGHL